MERDLKGSPEALFICISLLLDYFHSYVTRVFRIDKNKSYKK